MEYFQITNNSHIPFVTKVHPNLIDTHSIVEQWSDQQQQCDIASKLADFWYSAFDIGIVLNSSHRETEGMKSESLIRVSFLCCMASKKLRNLLMYSSRQLMRDIWSLAYQHGIVKGLVQLIKGERYYECERGEKYTTLKTIGCIFTCSEAVWWQDTSRELYNSKGQRIVEPVSTACAMFGPTIIHETLGSRRQINYDRKHNHNEHEIFFSDTHSFVQIRVVTGNMSTYSSKRSSTLIRCRYNLPMSTWHLLLAHTNRGTTVQYRCPHLTSLMKPCGFLCNMLPREHMQRRSSDCPCMQALRKPKQRRTDTEWDRFFGSLQTVENDFLKVSDSSVCMSEYDSDMRRLIREHEWEEMQPKCKLCNKKMPHHMHWQPWAIEHCRTVHPERYASLQYGYKFADSKLQETNTTTMNRIKLAVSKRWKQKQQQKALSLD